MNQLCKVCGEPAAGFHFGAFTCEGCKSFFGRTYNNLSSISECKNNGECVINKKNRTACKACRLRKCLIVGMSKSGSRYGRRSNWFKIHCLLQEQQNKVNNNNNNTSSNNNNNSSSNNTTSYSTVAPTNASLLQNDFISSHFLANLYGSYNNNGVHKAQEVIKRVSSPSDSGASSADLDETSVKLNNNNITKSRNLNQPQQQEPKVRSNSCSSEKREKSSSSPSDGYVSPNVIKPSFVPFPLTRHHHQHLQQNHHQSLSSSTSRVPSTQELFMLSLPQISLTPTPQHHHHHQHQQQQHKRHYSFGDEQSEPIDLSIKSAMASKRLRAGSDNEESESGKSIRSSTPDVAVATKTVPLDLTLVRSG